MTELQPTDAEVLQDETPEHMTAVPVIVESVSTPVRVQILPANSGGGVLSRVIDTTPVRVLTADPYRSTATLMLTYTGEVVPLLHVAYSRSLVEHAPATITWPPNVPLVLTNRTDVWVYATSTATLSVHTELWATGDRAAAAA
jgi:hypothetical protein